MTLADLGWDEAWQCEFAALEGEGWVPARLIRDNRITYGALLGDGEEREVVMGGKVYHEARTDAELPAVGDWVALQLGAEGEETVIRARLRRRTCLSRKAPGLSAEEQVIAANVDVVVVVTEAGPDFNERRLERYFALIGRSGARAVVLVNKVDLFSEKESQAAAELVRALNPEAEVHLTSAETGKGVRALKQYFRKGVSVAFVGSSGVGKSALVNQLLGDDYQWTGEVNEVTGKGRHTTSARELMVLRRGGIVIDNPGIREVQMWTDETTLRERFSDIEALSAQCRFHDCKHRSDAGCAIREAVDSGTLPGERYQGYLKLEDEIEKLRGRCKKRQMTLERRERREGREKVRNPSDRRELQRQKNPRRRILEEAEDSDAE
ncbi:MAG: ribosome small subunit-dependent GTPase [Verrucomicrobiota bacterium]|jgi:ribosome biogenesis GTPase